jgi:hypothetical protein
MKNHIIIALIGMSAVSVYAGDAYDVVNPHESMNPWKPTKGEVRMRERRMKAYYNAMEKKRANLNSVEQYYKDQESMPKFKRLERNYQNTFDAYHNSRFGRPTFPRIEKARESLSAWLVSWYQ